MAWGAHLMSNAHATILVVDDDPEIGELVTEALEPQGHHILYAANGEELKERLQERVPDLILLDIMLPDSDGLVLCADLHERYQVPIIICSGTSRKRDSLLSFRLGAEDFIAKPFHVEELEARVQAVLRRVRREQPPEGDVAPEERRSAAAQPGIAARRTIQHGPLMVDDARRRVTVEGRLVELTPTEYRLLSVLASNADEVLSRHQIASLLWGYEDASINRSIDGHIHRLRTKLALPEGQLPQIESVRGFGYRLSTH